MAFKTTMKKFWRLARSLHFHELGMGLMLAKFETKVDKKRVVTEGPSNFDMNLILLKEFDGIQ